VSHELVQLVIEYSECRSCRIAWTVPSSMSFWTAPDMSKNGRWACCLAPRSVFFCLMQSLGRRCPESVNGS